MKAAAREVADGVSRSRFRLKQLEEGVTAAEAQAAQSEAARDAAEQARLFAEVGAEHLRERDGYAPVSQPLLNFIVFLV